jgi:hypothetical protein
MTMSVGLIRSETSVNLRTPGSSRERSHTRRTLTAATAGTSQVVSPLKLPAYASLTITGIAVGEAGWTLISRLRRPDRVTSEMSALQGVHRRRGPRLMVHRQYE